MASPEGMPEPPPVVTPQTPVHGAVPVVSTGSPHGVSLADRAKILEVQADMMRMQAQEKEEEKRTQAERKQQAHFEQIVRSLRLDLWEQQERHERAQVYFTKLYYFLTAPQIVISGLLAIAAAVWPQGKDVSDSMSWTGKIVFTGGTVLNGALISVSNMFEISSKRDLHGQAAKLFTILLTGLRFNIEYTDALKDAVGSGTVKAYADDLLKYRGDRAEDL